VEDLSRTKYHDESSTKYESEGFLGTRKKILPHVLKITDKQIKMKAEKKNQLE